MITEAFGSPEEQTMADGKQKSRNFIKKKSICKTKSGTDKYDNAVGMVGIQVSIFL